VAAGTIGPVATPTLHRLSPEVYDRLVDSGLLDGFSSSRAVT
jgi:hypothetical protein